MVIVRRFPMGNFEDLLGYLSSRICWCIPNRYAKYPMFGSINQLGEKKRQRLSKARFQRCQSTGWAARPICGHWASAVDLPFLSSWIWHSPRSQELALHQEPPCWGSEEHKGHRVGVFVGQIAVAGPKWLERWIIIWVLDGLWSF